MPEGDVKQCDGQAGKTAEERTRVARQRCRLCLCCWPEQLRQPASSNNHNSQFTLNTRSNSSAASGRENK